MDFGYFLRRLDQGSRVEPSREAIVFEKERITHGQMRDRAYKTCQWLEVPGIEQGGQGSCPLEKLLRVV